MHCRWVCLGETGQGNRGGAGWGLVQMVRNRYLWSQRGWYELARSLRVSAAENGGSERPASVKTPGDRAVLDARRGEVAAASRTMTVALGGGVGWANIGIAPSARTVS